MLPQTAFAKAIGIAERIRQAIEAAAIPHPALAEDAVVTTSLGVASSQPGDGRSTGKVVADADAALYAAKRNGRNQVWPHLSSLSTAGAAEYKAIPAAR